MKVVNLRQGSDDWNHWRKKGIGASELSIVLGLSPYMTPKQLWQIKVGAKPAPDLSGNPHIIRGRKSEPLARRAMEQWLKHQAMLLPVCASHDDHSFILASFDGIDLNPQSPHFNIPVEIKCPSECVFKDVSFYGTQSVHYQMYACQVQQQLLVSGAKTGYLVFFFRGQILPFSISRDEAFLSHAIEKCRAFQQCVDTLRPPADDLEKDVFVPKGQVLKEWEALAEQIKKLIVAKKDQPENQQVQKDYINVKQRLANLTGGYRKGAAAGIQVTNVISGGSVNHKMRLDAVLRYLAEKGIPLDESLNEENFTTRQKEHIRVTQSNNPTPETITPNQPSASKLPRMSIKSW